jgi:hypothetical protein
MKTPRDILFARHQAAKPRLDAVRRNVLNVEFQEERRAVDTATLPMLIWRELIFPCRRIWAGLTAVWILIFIVNFSQRDGSQAVIAKSSPPPEMMMTFRDQQKWLDELLADRSLPADVGRPRIFSPKPRTETIELLTA